MGTLPSKQEINFLQNLITLTCTKILIELCLLKPYLTLRQAQRKYGPGLIQRWVEEGLIELIKDGERNCSVRIDRLRLELIAATSNRESWFIHNKKEQENEKVA